MHKNKAIFVFFSCLIIAIVPALLITEGATETRSDSRGANSQTTAVLDGTSFDPLLGYGGAFISVVENALTVDSMIQKSSSVNTVEGGTDGSTINTYIVQNGDTISGIAEKFSVSQNTIIWANDLRGTRIRIGQELAILPISGVLHTVQKGDTVKALAKKYAANEQDILGYNGIGDYDTLAVGQEVTVPYGAIPKAVAVSKPVVAKTTSTSNGYTAGVWNNTQTIWSNGVKTTALRNVNGPNLDSYYISPVSGYRKSRGLHGNNAVDWAAPSGTPVVAAAAGTVTIAKYGGWNGGYGKYVVIKHNNGTQTLYAHMSSVSVYSGQSVVAGQLVGRVGTTGNSTGNHLHFEVRGAQNPFR